MGCDSYGITVPLPWSSDNPEEPWAIKSILSSVGELAGKD